MIWKIYVWFQYIKQQNINIIADEIIKLTKVMQIIIYIGEFMWTVKQLITPIKNIVR